MNTGRVKEVETIPYNTNPLSVSEKNNKLRLILNLRHANVHVHGDKIKYEDWDNMLNYVENYCFMYKFEIKQGYYNIDIKPGHQKYLGFENKWKSFLFCVYCLTI